MLDHEPEVLPGQIWLHRAHPGLPDEYHRAVIHIYEVDGETVRGRYENQQRSVLGSDLWRTWPGRGNGRRITTTVESVQCRYLLIVDQVTAVRRQLAELQNVVAALGEDDAREIMAEVSGWETDWWGKRR